MIAEARRGYLQMIEVSRRHGAMPRATEFEDLLVVDDSLSLRGASLGNGGRRVKRLLGCRKWKEDIDGGLGQWIISLPRQGGRTSKAGSS